MPTITPQVRASIGGSEDRPISHRATLKVSTGMTMPQSAEAAPQTSPKTGQADIKEATVSPAVTLSPQMTALARKQQAQQEREAKLAAREAALAAKESDFIPKSAFKTKAQQNAVEALKDLGLSYEELTDLLLTQQAGDDPVRRLESKVEQLSKAQEENINKQYEATLKQYRAEAEALVTADPKTFHLINKGKHHDAVVQLIVDTWEENPDKVLTVAQAAKDVEEVLRENAKVYADALKELEPPKEETQPQQRQLPPPQRSAPRTLTNQVDVPPARTYGQFQHLSMKERIAQAVARAQR